jgi:quinol monooxygenase YgiN
MFIVARFHARPGEEVALHDAIARVTGRTRAEPGCLFVRFFRSIRDDGLFFIHSGWRSEDDFEKHASLPHTVEFMNAWEPLLDQPADVVRTVECVSPPPGRPAGDDRGDWHAWF